MQLCCACASSTAKPAFTAPTPHPARRLDSLVGLFAAKCAPTATADPYGLRRAAVGMLQALIAADARLDLAAAVEAAAAVQPIAVPAESRAAVLEFVERRLEQLLADGGAQIEAVRAALKERGRNAALAARTAKEISVRAGGGCGTWGRSAMCAGLNAGAYALAAGGSCLCPVLLHSCAPPPLPCPALQHEMAEGEAGRLYQVRARLACGPAPAAAPARRLARCITCARPPPRLPLPHPAPSPPPPTPTGHGGHGTPCAPCARQAD